MRYAGLALAALAVVVGCGGGSGSGNQEGTGTEGPVSQFGTIQTRGQVNGTPIVRDLDRISTVALAGTLTDATYRPQGRPDNETAIAVGNINSILMLFEDGQVVDEWKPTMPSAEDIYICTRWNADGSKLYFSSLKSGIYSVSAINPSTATLVVAGSNITYFSFSPDGTKILYNRVPSGESDTEVFVRPLAGGTTKRLTTNTNADMGGEWVDNDRVILYDGTPGGPVTKVVKVSDLTSTSYSPSGIDRWAVGSTPDKSYFFNSKAADSESNGVSISQLAPPLAFETLDYLPPETEVARSATISPDGTKWAVERTSVVYITELLPQTVRTILNKGPYFRLGAAWQPALPVTKFVGSGGRIGVTSAGIIATNRTGANDSQSSNPGALRNGLASFVSWDAQTRSTSTVSDDPTNGSAGAKSYVIEADRLTALRYANRPLFVGESTVSSSGTANGAIVTINAEDGTVRSIVVYQETRGGKPTIRREGNRKIVEGAILGVWNAKGENAAPGGSSRVVLDEKGNPTVE
ncbi:hypothetical protein EON81_03265 [bacterium]|nr:MAG: hypothetical protein EON81_03265 [bacterium]